MKSFTVKKIKNINNKVENFFVAPSPTFRDFFSAVESFNKENNKIENGLVYLDLITMLGDRRNRYIIAAINNYRLDINSIQVIGHNEDLEIFTKNCYANMSENVINFINPISYRNDIIAIRKNNKTKTDSLEKSVF